MGGIVNAGILVLVLGLVAVGAAILVVRLYRIG